MQGPIPVWEGKSQESRAEFVIRLLRWTADYLEEGIRRETQEEWTGETNHMIESVEADPDLHIKFDAGAIILVHTMGWMVESFRALTTALKHPNAKKEIVRGVKDLATEEMKRNAKSS